MRAAPPAFKPVDELMQFAHWFLRSPVFALRPPRIAVRNFGTVWGFVLFREPPYQVELFLATPGGEGVPQEYRHPDVDTFEVYLSGEIYFRLNGQQIATGEQVNSAAPDGASLMCGQLARIGPNDWHGLTLGPGGGAFMSIQRWRDGVEPASVGLNCEVPPAQQAN